LTAVRIWADRREVFAQHGSEIWKPESGQILFNFEVSSPAGVISTLSQRSSSVDESPETRAEDWYQKAVQLEQTDPDEAIEAYQFAIALSPHHFGAHLNLGRVFQSRNQLSSAETHFRYALRVDPSSATAAYHLGVALAALDLPGEAVEAFELAVQLEPGLIDAHRYLGRLYREAGIRKRAEQHLSGSETLNTPEVE
jgi:tetratricopeptide (TPR) repeat protein